jgi:hypothetical protein
LVICFLIPWSVVFLAAHRPAFAVTRATPDARSLNGMHNIVKILCRKKQKPTAALFANARRASGGGHPTRVARLHERYEQAGLAPHL